MEKAWLMNRCLFCVLLLIVMHVAPANGANVRTVALTGGTAPVGPNNNRQFESFGIVALNDYGQTAFYSTFSDDCTQFGGCSTTGLWSEGSGSLALVASDRSQAPGMSSGVKFDYFGEMAFGNAGKTAFWAVVPSSSSDRSGVWSERTGSLGLVFAVGDQAPGLPSSSKFSSLADSNFAFNDAGQTAFSARANSLPCIWSDRSGTLAPIVLFGQQAPGFPIGVNFNGTTDRRPSLNDKGQMAFRAYLIGIGINGSNSEGIWSEGSGSMALVARSGDHAPGTATGVSFGFLGLPVINNAGRTLFGAALTDNGVDNNQGSGIWTDRSGSLSLVARTGSQAPGLPNGIVFSNGLFDEHPFNAPVFNGAGQIAFRAEVTGPGVDDTNRSGIWFDDSGNLSLVARVGSQAPHKPAGVTFKWLLGLHLNDAGQIALSAGTSDGAEGIWATDRNGDLRPIIQGGDQLEVAPGDFRVVNDVYLELYASGSGDGRRSPFNNLGQIAFYAQFTDGSSGIFVSNLVAVPEPRSLLLAALAGSALLWRRRGPRCFSGLVAVVSFMSVAPSPARTLTIDMVSYHNVGNSAT